MGSALRKVPRSEIRKLLDAQDARSRLLQDTNATRERTLNYCLALIQKQRPSRHPVGDSTFF